jgi:hypothetical protein
VAQELMPEPGARAGALDEPGDVGDRRPAHVGIEGWRISSVQVHDAEVRLECRERVVRDLRRRSRDGGEQRRLAGVWQTDEPDVRDEPQLEPDPALLARLALLCVSRRLVCRGREVDVPQTATPPARGHDRLASRHEVRDQRACGIVVHGRARRDVEDQVVAGLAVPARALAPAAGRRSKVVPVLEVAQGRLARVDAQLDRRAATAITAVGAAARHVRLTPEGRGSVAAVAGTERDLHAVEEHPAHLRTRIRGSCRSPLVRATREPSSERRPGWVLLVLSSTSNH